MDTVHITGFWACACLACFAVGAMNVIYAIFTVLKDAAKWVKRRIG